MAAALDDAVETVRLVAGFDFPEMDSRTSMSRCGRTVRTTRSKAGRSSPRPGWRSSRTFDRHLVEEQVAWSNALHSRLVDGGASYVVGPLARYSLSSDRLSPLAPEIAREAGLGPTCRNPFRSIVVRAVETVYACDEALRIIDGWDGAPAAVGDVDPRAGVGYGATEAPRGLLFHRYELAEDGTILDAPIVPPTAQNQPSIEADLTYVRPGTSPSTTNS